MYLNYLEWLKTGGKKYFSKAYDCLTYDGTIKKYKTVSTHSWYYKDNFENITPDVKYESETLIFSTEDTPSTTDTINQTSKEITQPIQQSQEPIINHFKLNTTKGLIELFNTTESQIISKLKQVFPNTKDEVIKKIANNSNYKN